MQSTEDKIYRQLCAIRRETTDFMRNNIEEHNMLQTILDKLTRIEILYKGETDAQNYQISNSPTKWRV